MRFVWISLAAIATLAGLGSWWIFGTVNQSTGSNSADVMVTIAKGAGVRDISSALAQQKLIRSPQAWTLYVLLTGVRSDIHTGTFTFNRGMTGREILRLLTSLPTDDRQVKVKILEGSRNTDIAAQLEKAGVISAADFLAAAGTKDSRLVVTDKAYGFLASKPASVDLEGFLFPDTYYFFKHSSASAVLRKFLDNFDLKYTPAMRQATTAQGRTIFQEVTMGSILEAELQTDVDRALAADIFWRRLEAGMGLNADTTILYALDRKTGSVTSADLQVDSPYNTYTHRGLPAGPIGNPGLSALRAAITPKANDYWYYLTASDGHTVYAKTLEEHNRNKMKYLR